MAKMRAGDDMNSNHVIVKIGLAVTKDNRLLIVREMDEQLFILPGGRPEHDEDDLAALRREIHEELGCVLLDTDVRFAGSFSDVAATDRSKTVTIRLYQGQIRGTISPSSEIEELKWFSAKDDDANILAPSIKNKILPFLIASGAVRT